MCKRAHASAPTENLLRVPSAAASPLVPPPSPLLLLLLLLRLLGGLLLMPPPHGASAAGGVPHGAGVGAALATRGTPPLLLRLVDPLQVDAVAVSLCLILSP